MEKLAEGSIHITFQFSEEYAEVLPGDVESTEVALEQAISQLLLELFGEPIFVGDVTVKYSSLQQTRTW